MGTPLDALSTTLGASDRQASWGRGRGRDDDVHGADVVGPPPTVEHLTRFRDLYEEWDMCMTDERPAGTAEDELALHVLLDGPQFDRKLAALAALASQTRSLMAELDPAVYDMQVAEEAFIDASEARQARPDVATAQRR